MNLLEKIDLFYKLAQELDSDTEDNNFADSEIDTELSLQSSSKDRMKKLSALIKR
jgi:hypothetical protein